MICLMDAPRLTGKQRGFLHIKMEKCFYPAFQCILEGSDIGQGGGTGWIMFQVTLELLSIRTLKVRTLLGDIGTHAIKFTASADMDVLYLHMIVKVHGSTSLIARVYSDNANEPDTQLGYFTFNPSYVEDDIYVEYVAKEENDSAISLTAATNYWLVLIFASDDDDDAYFGVKGATDLENNKTLKSTDNVTWATGTTVDNVFFRLLPEWKDYKVYFTEHKRSLIISTNYDDGTKSEVYVLGDSGTATGGSTTTLVDTTKTWTTDEHKGKILYLSDGTGSVQRLPFTICTSNTNNTLTLSALDVAPAAGTEYTFLDSNIFRKISPAGGDAWAAGKQVTDMMSYGGAIYFAHGDATSMTKLQRYTSGGAWTNDYDIEGNAVGSILTSGVDSDGRAVYIAKRSTPEVFRAPAVDATGTTTAADLVPVSKGLVGDGTSKINGMLLYGEYGELTVLTSNSFYSYYNDGFHEKRVPEMRHTQDDRNGRAQDVAGMYLYFSWHNSVLRYYESNLDDIGPNNSEMEMPYTIYKKLLGNATEFTTYAGGILIVAINGGLANQSSVIMWTGSGWCEVWRSPYMQEGIRNHSVYNVHTMSVEGDAVDWIYINWGSDIVKVPISLNPPAVPVLYDYKAAKPVDYGWYPFRWGGYLVTGWMRLNLYDVQKYFHSIKAVVDKNIGSGVELYVDYQVDDSTSSWNVINTTSFSTFYTKQNMTSDNSLSGRRIRLRFRIDLNDAGTNVTPVIISTVMEAIVRFPNKHQYDVNYRTRDRDLDLLGAPDPYQWANDKQNKLEEFAELSVPVYVTSSIYTLNNKYMFVETPSARLLEYVDKRGEEFLMGHFSLIEVS
jgi:hypothetical protein